MTLELELASDRSENLVSRVVGPSYRSLRRFLSLSPFRSRAIGVG